MGKASAPTRHCEERSDEAIWWDMAWLGSGAGACMSDPIASALRALAMTRRARGGAGSIGR